MGKTGRLVAGSILLVFAVLFVVLSLWLDYFYYVPRAYGIIILLMFFSAPVMAIVGIILIVFGLRSEKPIVQMQMQPVMPPLAQQPMQPMMPPPTRQTMQPAVQQPMPQYNCIYCGYPLIFINPEQKWYCDNCKVYVG